MPNLKKNLRDPTLKFVLDQFGAKSKIVSQRVFDKYDRTSNFIIWKEENEIKFIDKDHFVALYIRARQLKNSGVTHYSFCRLLFPDQEHLIESLMNGLPVHFDNFDA
jgi:hypothetical protein